MATTKKIPWNDADPTGEAISLTANAWEGQQKISVTSEENLGLVRSKRVVFYSERNNLKSAATIISQDRATCDVYIGTNPVIKSYAMSPNGEAVTIMVATNVSSASFIQVTKSSDLPSDWTLTGLTATTGGYVCTLTSTLATKLARQGSITIKVGNLDAQTVSFSQAAARASIYVGSVGVQYKDMGLYANTATIVIDTNITDTDAITIVKRGFPSDWVLSGLSAYNNGKFTLTVTGKDATASAVAAYVDITVGPLDKQTVQFAQSAATLSAYIGSTSVKTKEAAQVGETFYITIATNLNAAHLSVSNTGVPSTWSVGGLEAITGGFRVKVVAAKSSTTAVNASVTVSYTRTGQSSATLSQTVTLTQAARSLVSTSYSAWAANATPSWLFASGNVGTAASPKISAAGATFGFGGLGSLNITRTRTETYSNGDVLTPTETMPTSATGTVSATGATVSSSSTTLGALKGNPSNLFSVASKGTTVVSSPSSVSGQVVLTYGNDTITIKPSSSLPQQPNVVTSDVSEGSGKWEVQGDDTAATVQFISGQVSDLNYPFVASAGGASWGYGTKGNGSTNYPFTITKTSQRTITYTSGEQSITGGTVNMPTSTVLTFKLTSSGFYTNKCQVTKNQVTLEQINNSNTGEMIKYASLGTEITQTPSNADQIYGEFQITENGETYTLLSTSSVQPQPNTVENYSLTDSLGTFSMFLDDTMSVWSPLNYQIPFIGCYYGNPVKLTAQFLATFTSGSTKYLNASKIEVFNPALINPTGDVANPKVYSIDSISDDEVLSSTAHEFMQRMDISASTQWGKYIKGETNDLGLSANVKATVNIYVRNFKGNTPANRETVIASTPSNYFKITPNLNKNIVKINNTTTHTISVLGIVATKDFPNLASFKGYTGRTPLGNSMNTYHSLVDIPQNIGEFKEVHLFKGAVLSISGVPSNALFQFIYRTTATVFSTVQYKVPLGASTIEVPAYPWDENANWWVSWADTNGLMIIVQQA